MLSAEGCQLYGQTSVVNHDFGQSDVLGSESSLKCPPANAANGADRELTNTGYETVFFFSCVHSPGPLSLLKSYSDHRMSDIL
jgi:hypothetical protein